MAQPNHRRNKTVIARVRELHAQGLGRNAIARELDIGQQTTSLIAADAGLSFDRRRTEQATRAKRADAADRRQAIIHRLYDEADAALDRLAAPTHEYSEVSAGKLIHWLTDNLSAPDTKALVLTVGTAVDKAIRLEQIDARDGADDVASMLGALGDALLTASDQLDSQTPTGEEPPSP